MDVQEPVSIDLSDLVDEPKPVVLTPSTLGGLTVQAVEQSQPYINLMVYGDSGVGKTRLAGSAADVEDMSPVLFIDVEGGTFSLRDTNPEVQVVRVKTWKDMIKLYDELYDMKHGYRTVVLDSVTETQKFSMYNIMSDLVQKERDRDPDIPSVREWGKNIEQIRALVRGFRDLPMNCIVTALATGDRNPRTGITTLKPQLSGKLSGEVAAFLDIVVYYYIKVVNGQKVRVLLTDKTEEQVAKDRSDRLPMIIQNPSMQVLYDYIHGNVVAAQES